MSKRIKIALGATAVVALSLIGGGIALAIPAQAENIVPTSSSTSTSQGIEDGTNDGETADDQGVEDGTADGETADDQGVEDGTADGETADD